MNSTISKTMIPPAVAAPRGAEWAANLAGSLVKVLAKASTAVWRALQAYGERRARAHMLQWAEMYQYSRPAVAKALREASR